MYKGLVLSVFVWCSVSASHAAIVSLTMSGRVSEFQYETRAGGIDAVAALIPLGTSYSFSYSYDTTMALSSGVLGFDEFYARALRSGTFTLGGNSISINPAQDFNGVGVTGNRTNSFPRYSVFTNFSFGAELIGGFRGIDFNGDLFDTRRTANPGPGLPSFVNVADYDSQAARIRLVSFPAGEVGVGLRIDRITTVVSGVPEPQSWMMLLAGFGACGYAIRRKRPKFIRV